MDPLSDVLAMIRPRSYMFRGFEAAGRWSLRFAAHVGVRCYALQSGSCWLVVDGLDQPILISAGDCVLVTGRQSFNLSSDPALMPIEAMSVFAKAPEGEVVRLNGGGDQAGLGGYFDFEGRHASVLLGLLPAVIHIRIDADKARLRASIEAMAAELRDPQPGSAVIAQHLGQMMLVLALRAHLSSGIATGFGWLFALGDRQLGPVLNALHADPARRWTLESLAVVANMSRSSFAQKFKQAVGEPPMEYLLRWRMMLAGEKLMTSGESIASIAGAVGYESESAFSAAFRRVIGCAPREYASLQVKKADPAASADPALLGLGSAG